MMFVTVVDLCVCVCVCARARVGGRLTSDASSNSRGVPSFFFSTPVKNVNSHLLVLIVVIVSNCFCGFSNAQKQYAGSAVCDAKATVAF